jgi:hypothetical protein
MLKLSGMVLTYHPVGYMIQKGAEILAEHLVISQVEYFVANLEYRLEHEAWWDSQRLLEPGREPWCGMVPSESRNANDNVRPAASRPYSH